MNSKLLVAFLAVFPFTGCVIRGGSNPPPPQAGDVTFTWSFAGKGCAEVPQVKSVLVSIPGETLQNNGVFPCLADNYPGIVLHNFVPGTYSYTLEAVGYGNESLYVGSGTFTVNGDVRATLDLTPVGGPNSYAYLTWRFPPLAGSNDPSCELAGIAYMDVSIDGATAVRYNCVDGMSDPGAQTPFLAAGTHSIHMTAVTADDYPFYYFNGSLQTNAGNPIASHYDVLWAVGGTAVKWTLIWNSVESCESAGVTNMNVNFLNTATNEMLYGTVGTNYACNQAPILYDRLPPGTYEVYAQGTGSGSIMYLSDDNAPPVVTVVAGEFKSEAQATNVPLYRAQ